MRFSFYSLPEPMIPYSFSSATRSLPIFMDWAALLSAEPPAVSFPYFRIRFTQKIRLFFQVRVAPRQLPRRGKDGFQQAVSRFPGSGRPPRRSSVARCGTLPWQTARPMSPAQSVSQSTVLSSSEARSACKNNILTGSISVTRFQTLISDSTVSGGKNQDSSGRWRQPAEKC